MVVAMVITKEHGSLIIVNLCTSRICMLRPLSHAHCDAEVSTFSTSGQSKLARLALLAPCLFERVKHWDSGLIQCGSY